MSYKVECSRGPAAVQRCSSSVTVTIHHQPRSGDTEMQRYTEIIFIFFYFNDKYKWVAYVCLHIFHRLQHEYIIWVATGICNWNEIFKLEHSFINWNSERAFQLVLINEKILVVPNKNVSNFWIISNFPDRYCQTEKYYR